MPAKLSQSTSARRRKKVVIIAEGILSSVHELKATQDASTWQRRIDPSVFHLYAAIQCLRTVK